MAGIIIAICPCCPLSPNIQMNPISHDPAVRCVVGLRKRDLHQDPFAQFKLWFDEVVQAKLPEPTAMTLATSTPDGVPSARIVLLKGFDEQGFVFFTNFQSQKGRELELNPRAALVFFWPTLERQVRITGAVAKVSREESETYFHLRPVGSQIGAWASQQSQVLANREELDRRVDECTRRYENQVVPLPPYWGGYRLNPVAFEFWQARLNRLHDRFRYVRSETGWGIERLSP